ncbi:MAG: hypothetical protein JST01_06310 [Cyanobacteria bacterium SZAS TMP-1]|nr:hypothetical protein [Cyanobacteria bacterium SZAS TMP-1]
MPDIRTAITCADNDAVNLGDKGTLANSASGLQALFDQTINMAYGKRELLLNAYVKEANIKADDIYGKGNHATLEIVDSNKNDHIDLADKIRTTTKDGVKIDAPMSSWQRENNSW